MIFNSWVFAIFLLGFFLIYWLALKPERRPMGLLVAGLVFYAYYFPAYTLLIVLLTLFVFYMGERIRKFRAAKPEAGWKTPYVFLWISVTVCILVLGYFKYLRLLLSTLNMISEEIGFAFALTVPSMLVPLGLSFFVFEFIHYLVDCYHGRTKPSSLVEFGVFALFFPSMVAGPIKRFQPFINQLREYRPYKAEYFNEGAARMLKGLAKKILVADMAGNFVLPLTEFSSNPGVSTFSLWVAVYAYAVKIYFDFSGYSDIAIGCARLFGYELPENFKRPYLSQNISDFWKRWHMSLSSWLREYLYMPVGKKLMATRLKKRPLLLATACQMITMAICGLWHGAYWNFLAWGLYHGIGLSIHRVFDETVLKYKRKRQKRKAEATGASSGTPEPGFGGKLKRAFYVLLTFQFVVIGWVFFVLNLDDALKVLNKLLFIGKIMEVLQR